MGVRELGDGTPVVAPGLVLLGDPLEELVGERAAPPPRLRPRSPGHAWRRDEWKPELDSAGLPHRTPYSMRHTFASFAIAAGVSLFYLARLMGTSVEQIDRTDGHMLPESEDYLRGLLDGFDLVAPRAAISSST